MIKDLVHKNRSYRKFHQDVPVELETLKELVDLTWPGCRLQHSICSH